MKHLKFLLQIFIILGAVIFFVGCSQETPIQEPETETKIPPTETRIPPTATTIPPTKTQIPPTETKAPPTETQIPPTEIATLKPPENAIVIEFTESDLLGTWVSESPQGLRMTFQENGNNPLYEGETIDYNANGRYELHGDVLSHTLNNCTKVIGIQVHEFRCTAEYKITMYRDDNNQVYMGLVLIGEDEHSFRKYMLGSPYFWLKVDED